MGFLSRRLARRIAKVDQARVDLFELEPGEFPVEAQGALVTSVWPSTFGLPMAPKDAESTTYLLPGGGLHLSLMAVLLLTESRFHWVPNRTYRGSRVLSESIDRHLAEGAPHDRGIYSLFPNPMFGPRSVPLRKVERIALDVFRPGLQVLVNIYLTDPGCVMGGGPWPLYQLQHVDEYIPYPAEWWTEGRDETSPYLQFYAEGAMCWTFSTLMAQGLQALDIPIQTDSLTDEQRLAWNEWSSGVGSTRPWKPLSQRLKHDE